MKNSAKSNEKKNAYLSIKQIVSDCSERSHGELFLEVYRMGISEKISIAEFATEHLKNHYIDIAEDENEEEKSREESRSYIKLIEEGKFSKPILDYFYAYSSHGEWAGLAIAACQKDKDRELANKIFENLDPDGFDS